MKEQKRPTMHPRNIYNKRLDFKELAKEFPEFKENTTIDLTGRVHLDFKNPAALRAFSKTLLKKDFNLDVNIPPNTLVPTIPLRLNYILFIEDLLQLANVKDNIKGLDIGIGASCVYPLIAARKNGWSMVGTDINSDSIACANKNIEANQLENIIKVLQVSDNSIINEVLENNDTKYDFCMCNPPFFGDVSELDSQLKGKPNRPPPKNAPTAASHEAITEGGEVEFVSKLIEESCHYPNRIRIFTSMLGIKSSILPLITKLKEISDVKSTTLTEFYQGHTTRFGIAWTFDETIKLETLPVPARLQRSQNIQNIVKPYVHCIKPYTGNIAEAKYKLEEIFNELEFKYTHVESNNTTQSYNIKTYKNTWTHNRRKRREQAHAVHNKQTTEISDTSTSSIPADADMNQNPDGSNKRKAGEENVPDTKRFKSDEDQETDTLLECTLSMYKQNSELFIELLFVDGTGGKTASHQVLQYIKNHLKFE